MQQHLQCQELVGQLEKVQQFNQVEFRVQSSNNTKQVQEGVVTPTTVSTECGRFLRAEIDRMVREARLQSRGRVHHAQNEASGGLANFRDTMRAALLRQR